jgi:hypothetical protein
LNPYSTPTLILPLQGGGDIELISPLRGRKLSRIFKDSFDINNFKMIFDIFIFIYFFD